MWRRREAIMKRILLAGIVGGLALFLWGTLAHVVLPLGRVGIKEIPQEPAVLGAMKTAMPEPGFYFFPGIGVGSAATKAEKDAAMRQFQQRYMAGPYGILIYHPTGTTPMSPGQLLTELALNIVEALLAAWLLTLATGLTRFASRVGIVVVAGVLASISTNVEYWNWYGFPTNYTVTYIFTDVVGFLVIGLVLAKVIKANLAAPEPVLVRAG
jgi:hypothetical protein